ncbi:hypothetical protein ACWDN6_14885 [Streptomyces albogriseolus]
MEDTVLHQALIVVEIQQADPDPDGWIQVQATGRACIVCPCGLNTGFIDKAEAAQQHRDHLENRFIRHYPENAQAQAVVNEMVGDLMGEG